jgi:hypothetical protein
MNLPFNTEQFLDVFGVYNLAVWPMQILFVFLALTAIFLSIYKTNFSDITITIILLSYWLWIGVVYHFIFFTRINGAAFIFAILFVIQSMLFFYYGIIKRSLHFQFSNNIRGVTAIIIFIYALIFYPLLGYAFGHHYPRTPTFGLPCPTTIFTFGMLLLLEGKVPKFLFVIPIIWALIGFTAALKLGIIQDIGLIIAAAATVLLFLEKREKHF